MSLRSAIPMSMVCYVLEVGYCPRSGHSVISCPRVTLSSLSLLVVLGVTLSSLLVVLEIAL